MDPALLLQSSNLINLNINNLGFFSSLKHQIGQNRTNHTSLEEMTEQYASYEHRSKL